jgi:hypothetical protein
MQPVLLLVDDNSQVRDHYLLHDNQKKKEYINS